MQDCVCQANEPISRAMHMSRGRRTFLLGVLALLLLGHARLWIHGWNDRWPFSRYAMYAYAREPVVKAVLPFGVIAQEPAREIRLRKWEHLQPLYEGSTTTALRRLARRADGPERLREAAADILRRYEQNRRLGRHDGPPLRALRIYEARWRMLPGAPNRAAPDETRLLAEAHGGEPAADEP